MVVTDTAVVDVPDEPLTVDELLASIMFTASTPLYSHTVISIGTLAPGVRVIVVSVP
jgi:hypothetical protein